MIKDTWNAHKLEANTEANWNIGDVALTVKSIKDEIWVASNHNAEEKEPKWSRWALKKNVSAFHLAPAFPDKSIVVKPENPFRLLPGVEARIYVRVPIWLAIKLNAKDAKPLTEIPSVVLSLTWFGTPTEGELCYWISSSARREVVADAERDYLAICPVQLKNSSDESLLVEKLCLRVKWLSLYEKDSQLWANETKVSYRGGADMSQVNVTNGPPKEATKAALVSSPRETTRKSFSMRTFFSWGEDEPTSGAETDVK